MKNVKQTVYISAFFTLGLGLACKKPKVITEPMQSVNLVNPIVSASELPGDTNIENNIIENPITDTDAINIKQTPEVLSLEVNTDPKETVEPKVVDESSINKVIKDVLVSESLLTNVLNDINFDLDKSGIREDDKIKLKNLANFLIEHREVKIQIAGNCDERGTSEYNLVLGERRADSARNYLIRLGVPVDRLSIISYGKEKPKSDGHNEASWFMNRNCQFLVK